MQTAANKIRLTWLGLFWLLAGLLGACSSRSGTTTVPPTAVFFAPPTLTPDSPAARPDPKRTATVFPAEREITFERPLEAIYLPGEVHELYRFYSDQPRRIGITLEPLDDENDLRLQVLVYDTHQQSLTRAAGPEADPLLRGVWEVPAPGWYTIQVYGPEDHARAFRLALVILAVPQNSGGMIGYGEARSGEIAIAGQRDQWTFEGQAGEHVSISMLAPSADAYLMLYAPDGSLIAQNDDGPQGGPHPMLDLLLPSTGNYMIVARLYGDDQTGAYRLSLERIE